jgi:hypothetical protein
MDCRLFTLLGAVEQASEAETKYATSRAETRPRLKLGLPEYRWLRKKVHVNKTLGAAKFVGRQRIYICII